MNKTHGFSLGIVSVMMTAFLAIMIVLTMSTNVVAISVLNSEHLVYVGGSPSPDNTTGEPTEESDIDSSAAVALITISRVML